MRYLGLLILAFLFFSCETEEQLDRPGSTRPAPNGIAMNQSGLQAFLQNADGLFISLLIDDGANKTDHFQSYTFRFDEKGVVSASSADEQHLGSYFIFEDDNRIELSMAFSSSGSFAELNDDWYYIETIESSIRFEDDLEVENYQLEFSRN